MNARRAWLVAIVTIIAAMAGPSAAIAEPPAASSTRPANRLAGEASPYLRLHAHNPVDWYPWGEEAFAKAKRENKPIFLSVGYATCHWCHVMARESFENADIDRGRDGFHPPRPPNRAGGFPAHGSPVGGCPHRNRLADCQAA